MKTSKERDSNLRSNHRLIAVAQNIRPRDLALFRVCQPPFMSTIFVSTIVKRSTFTLPRQFHCDGQVKDL